MRLDCPHCGQGLEYSGSRPSFCGYCGKGITQQTLDATTAHQVEGPTEAPQPSGGDSEPELKTVGGYRLVRPLGAGGMGTVYEAEETATGRHVALKLIAAEFATSHEALERFRREGRLASGIAHPRCVFVVAADEEAGRPYIVMELMPGATLKDVVEQRGALPLQEAVAKILDVIDGLREAHRLGVVHRDVKPSNCFVEADGRVKIGDFGLSKSLALDGHLTRTGSFVGTPLFASPEQVRGEAVDHQSDVYSVAATLYCMLTGRAPFQSTDATITLVKIVSDPTPPMRAVRPELPQALDEVVLRGLERDRPRRWRDLDDFRSALLPFVPGQQSAPPLGLRFGAFLIDYFILLAIGTVVGLFWWYQFGDEVVHPPTANRHAVWQTFVGMLMWALYFIVPESIWGCSFGKLLLGLRVRTAVGSVQPDLGKIALRLVVFYVLVNLGSLFVLSLMWIKTDMPSQAGVVLSLFVGLAFYPFEALGLGLIFCTMRARNGYRGLHEFASGTRVIWLRPQEKRRPVGAARLDQDLGHPAGLPERIGAYAIRGAFRTSGVRLLLGDDEALQRQVIIHLRPLTEPPLDSKRRELTRPTRLRWVAGGRIEGEQWDAFLAPAGTSLPELTSEQAGLPWKEVRPILEQLAEELTIAAKEGTSPLSLSVDQVRVQSGGHVQLMDWSLREADVTSSPQQGLTFLGQTAMMALEGRPWNTEEAGGVTLVAKKTRNRRRFRHPPVPEHAAGLLARLLGFKEPFRNVREFECELAETRDRATEVTRARRAAHVAVFSALIFFVVISCMLPVGAFVGFMSFMGLLVESETKKETLRDLEKGTWRDFAVSAVNPDPVVRLSGLAQLDADLQLRKQLLKRIEDTQRQRDAHLDSLSWFMRKIVQFIDDEIEKEKAKGNVVRDKKSANSSANFRKQASAPTSSSNSPPPLDAVAIGCICWLAFWPVIWVLWAFVWRGGFSFSWMGLALARSDGRKAARWQCALRALLLWLPVFGLLAGAVWLDAWFWLSLPTGVPDPWLWWVSCGLWYGGVLLLPLYALLAIQFPLRGLHDWLVGTYLVPR
jgi:eukaryotic-like serine/threonine-protein kinase